MAKRQRNKRGRFIPQTDSIVSNDMFIPNHSGVTSHPEMLVENIKTNFSDFSVIFSYGGKLIEDNADFTWNHLTQELELGGSSIIEFAGDFSIGLTADTDLIEGETDQVTINGDLIVTNGASGNFTTVDGKTVTVVSGIITAIV